MKRRPGILLFALIEILIGAITLSAILLGLARGESAKPPGVLIFVLISCGLSILLGVGIIKYNLRSYYLLLYFSSMIILSKVLIFSGIITLSGAMESSIPSHLKNAVSILYHGALILYFTRKPVRMAFHKHENSR